MENIRVKVLQSDIDHGIRGSFDRCPVALALYRIKPGAHISVGQDVTIFDIRTYAMPPEANIFVRAFDREKPVEPFEFDLIPR